MEAKTITYLGTVLTSTYDARLVGISLVIAVIGSYTALDLAGQVSVAQGRARYFWLTGSAIALGISIWAMHFIAMLAYQLPIPITYVFSIVLISMAVATVGSIFGLFVVTRQPLGWLLLWSGSIFVGLGIIGMHFTAMAAMLLQAVPLYDLKLVFLSDLCAITLSLSALWLAFHPSAKTIGSESITARLAVPSLPEPPLTGCTISRWQQSAFTQPLNQYRLLVLATMYWRLQLVLLLWSSCC